jgi:hypothetical protein
VRSWLTPEPGDVPGRSFPLAGRPPKGLQSRCGTAPEGLGLEASPHKVSASDSWAGTRPAGRPDSVPERVIGRPAVAVAVAAAARGLREGSRAPRGIAGTARDRGLRWDRGLRGGSRAHQSDMSYILRLKFALSALWSGGVAGESAERSLKNLSEGTLTCGDAGKIKMFPVLRAGVWGCQADARGRSVPARRP